MRNFYAIIAALILFSGCSPLDSDHVGASSDAESCKQNSLAVQIMAQMMHGLAREISSGPMARRLLL